MTWEIFNVITMLMIVIGLAYSFYEFKSGPTKRERARFEKYYGRTMTEADMKSYKNGQKFVLFALTFALVLNIAF